MRCACIDIGSNTTRLLVAEPGADGLREVLSQRAFTRLRSTDGQIPPSRATELVDEVCAQVGLARQAGAESISVIATAAIRDAINGEELCAAVRRACGLEVGVLSCEDEARLAFAGVTGTLRRPPEGLLAVVDLGGGSCELVCGTALGGVSWSASVALGSGTLADRFIHGDPPAGEELEQIRAHVAGALAAVEPPAAQAAYAVGGSATSLRRLVGDELDPGTLAEGIRLVCAEPAEAVARRLDMHVERVRVIAAGMLVLEATCELLGRSLRIAAGGVREGVILERLAGAA